MEDLNAYLSNLLELCGTIKMNGVDHDFIKLKLFPFSLKKKAKNWFHNLAQGSIETWGEMVEAFLTKLISHRLTSQLRAEITQFRQGDQEMWYDAWDRFNEFQRKCSQHGYELLLLVKTLYNGLNYSTTTLVNAACGGSITSKMAKEANQTFEELAKNNYQAPFERFVGRRQGGISELD